MDRLGMSVASSVLVAGFAAAAGTPPPAAPAGEPVLFAAQSRIEVDAEGKVLSVSRSTALPDAIAAALEENLRKTRFSPARKDGVAVPGVTYARQEACAVPDEGRYRLAVRFLGNGPGAARFEGKREPLRLPANRQGPAANAEFKIGYRVQADGTIAMESFEQVSGRRNLAKEMEATIRRWLEGQRADPEQLDGKNVSTRVSFTLQFEGGGETFTGSNARQMAQRHAQAMMDAQRERQLAASGACAAAWAARDAQAPSPPIALNSPFQLLPAN